METMYNRTRWSARAPPGPSNDHNVARNGNESTEQEEPEPGEIVTSNVKRSYESVKESAPCIWSRGEENYNGSRNDSRGSRQSKWDNNDTSTLRARGNSERDDDSYRDSNQGRDYNRPPNRDWSTRVAAERQRSPSPSLRRRNEGERDRQTDRFDQRYDQFNGRGQSPPRSRESQVRETTGRAARSPHNRTECSSRGSAPMDRSRTSPSGQAREMTRRSPPAGRARKSPPRYRESVRRSPPVDRSQYNSRGDFQARDTAARPSEYSSSRSRNSPSRNRDSQVRDMAQRSSKSPPNRSTYSSRRSPPVKRSRTSPSGYRESRTRDTAKRSSRSPSNRPVHSSKRSAPDERWTFGYTESQDKETVRRPLELSRTSLPRHRESQGRETTRKSSRSPSNRPVSRRSPAELSRASPSHHIEQARNTNRRASRRPSLERSRTSPSRNREFQARDTARRSSKSPPNRTVYSSRRSPPIERSRISPRRSSSRSRTLAGQQPSMDHDEHFQTYPDNIPAAPVMPYSSGNWSNTIKSIGGGRPVQIVRKGICSFGSSFGSNCPSASASEYTSQRWVQSSPSTRNIQSSYGNAQIIDRNVVVYAKGSNTVGSQNNVAAPNYRYLTGNEVIVDSSKRQELVRSLTAQPEKLSEDTESTGRKRERSPYTVDERSYHANAYDERSSQTGLRKSAHRSQSPVKRVASGTDNRKHGNEDIGYSQYRIPEEYHGGTDSSSNGMFRGQKSRRTTSEGQYLSTEQRAETVAKDSTSDREHKRGVTSAYKTVSGAEYRDYPELDRRSTDIKEVSSNRCSESGAIVQNRRDLTSNTSPSRHRDQDRKPGNEASSISDRFGSSGSRDLLATSMDSRDDASRPEPKYSDKRFGKSRWQTNEERSITDIRSKGDDIHHDIAHQKPMRTANYETKGQRNTEKVENVSGFGTQSDVRRQESSHTHPTESKALSPKLEAPEQKRKSDTNTPKKDTHDHKSKHNSVLLRKEQHEYKRKPGTVPFKRDTSFRGKQGIVPFKRDMDQKGKPGSVPFNRGADSNSHQPNGNDQDTISVGRTASIGHGNTPWLKTKPKEHGSLSIPIKSEYTKAASPVILSGLPFAIPLKKEYREALAESRVRKESDSHDDEYFSPKQNSSVNEEELDQDVDVTEDENPADSAKPSKGSVKRASRMARSPKKKKGQKKRRKEQSETTENKGNQLSDEALDDDNEEEEEEKSLHEADHEEEVSPRRTRSKLRRRSVRQPSPRNKDKKDFDVDGILDETNVEQVREKNGDDETSNERQLEMSEGEETHELVTVKPPAPLSPLKVEDMSDEEKPATTPQEENESSSAIDYDSVRAASAFEALEKIREQKRGRQEKVSSLRRQTSDLLAHFKRIQAREQRRITDYRTFLYSNNKVEVAKYLNCGRVIRVEHQSHSHCESNFATLWEHTTEDGKAKALLSTFLSSPDAGKVEFSRKGNLGAILLSRNREHKVGRRTRNNILEVVRSAHFGQARIKAGSSRYNQLKPTPLSVPVLCIRTLAEAYPRLVMERNKQRKLSTFSLLRSTSYQCILQHTQSNAPLVKRVYQLQKLRRWTYKISCNSARQLACRVFHQNNQRRKPIRDCIERTIDLLDGKGSDETGGGFLLRAGGASFSSMQANQRPTRTASAMASQAIAASSSSSKRQKKSTARSQPFESDEETKGRRDIEGVSSDAAKLQSLYHGNAYSDEVNDQSLDNSISDPYDLRLLLSENGKVILDKDLDSYGDSHRAGVSICNRDPRLEPPRTSTGDARLGCVAPYFPPSEANIFETSKLDALMGYYSTRRAHVRWNVPTHEAMEQFWPKESNCEVACSPQASPVSSPSSHRVVSMYKSSNFGIMRSSSTQSTDLVGYYMMDKKTQNEEQRSRETVAARLPGKSPDLLVKANGLPLFKRSCKQPEENFVLGCEILSNARVSGVDYFNGVAENSLTSRTLVATPQFSSPYQIMDDVRTRLTARVHERPDTRTQMPIWRDIEKLIFLEKFLVYPKEFELISSYLPEKSYNDCANFYYEISFTANLKEAIRILNASVRAGKGCTSFQIAIECARRLGVHIPKELQVTQPSKWEDIRPVTDYIPAWQTSLIRHPDGLYKLSEFRMNKTGFFAPDDYPLLSQLTEMQVVNQKMDRFSGSVSEWAHLDSDLSRYATEQLAEALANADESLFPDSYGYY